MWELDGCFKCKWVDNMVFEKLCKDTSLKKTFFFFWLVSKEENYFSSFFILKTIFHPSLSYCNQAPLQPKTKVLLIFTFKPTQVVEIWNIWLRFLSIHWIKCFAYTTNLKWFEWIYFCEGVEHHECEFKMQILFS